MLVVLELYQNVIKMPGFWTKYRHVLAVDIKILNTSVLFPLSTRLKIPDICLFWIILDTFQVTHFETSLQPRTLIFSETLVQAMYL